MASLVVYANANYAHPNATSGGWSSPTNAYADDGSYATRTGTTKNIWYGNLFGFDLSLLSDSATVSAISLEVQWKNSANDSSGPVLGIAAYYNGAIVGTEATDTSGQTSDELLTKAPTGITVAELKTTGDTGFAAGVRFRRTDNTAHTASIDYVKCTITYTFDITGTATMSGADNDSASGKKAGNGSAIVSAVGTCVVVGVIALFGLGVISGGGTTTASGSGIKEPSGTASMSAVGTTVATGAKGTGGTGSVTCTKAVSASGAKATSNTASISCGTACSTSGKMGAKSSTFVTCGQSTSGSGKKGAIGSPPSVSGGGATTASGEKDPGGAVIYHSTRVERIKRAVGATCRKGRMRW